MILKHYARDPEFIFDSGRAYELNREDSPMIFKPNGLWVSVEGEDDWKTWCSAENFAVETLSNEHDVALNEGANILYIRSLVELANFTAEYGRTYYNHIHWIDWEVVIRKYDGVIITPYQRDVRLTESWYYGWDCASGVIWNLTAIEKVEATHVRV